MPKARLEQTVFISVCAILLVTLFSLPIFNDESIFLKWAIGAKQSNDLLFSLTHGDKPPLLTWLLLPATLVPTHPYLVGRLLMLLSTLLAALVIWKTYSISAAIIFLTLPYTIIFGRQILAEPVIFLFVTLFIWQRNTKNQISAWFFLGLLFALSIYLKFNLSLFLLLLIIPSLAKAKPQQLLICLLPCAVLLFPFIFPNFRHLFASQQQFFQLSVSPTVLLTRINTLFFQSIYFLPVLPLLFPLNHLKKHLDTIIPIVIYLAVYLLFTSDTNSRYLAPLVPAIISVLNYSRPRLLLLSGFIFISFNPQLFLKYAHQDWDYAQYYTHWTSGVGLDRLKSDIDNQATKPTIVFIRPDSGHPEDFLVVSYGQTNKTQLAYATPANLDYALQKAPADYQLFFVSRDLQLPDPRYKLELMSTYPKATTTHFVNLYRLIRD